jgi:hypothetical protein
MHARTPHIVHTHTTPSARRASHACTFQTIDRSIGICVVSARVASASYPSTPIISHVIHPSIVIRASRSPRCTYLCCIVIVVIVIVAVIIYRPLLVAMCRHHTRDEHDE